MSTFSLRFEKEINLFLAKTNHGVNRGDIFLCQAVLVCLLVVRIVVILLACRQVLLQKALDELGMSFSTLCLDGIVKRTNLSE